MTDGAMVTVSVDDVMEQIREGLQKVLSATPELKDTLDLIWLHAGAMEQVIGFMAGMIAESQVTADALLAQRNQAVECMDGFRRHLTHAPAMERQRLADRLAERCEIDPVVMRRALDHLGGNTRGDGSQFAEMDVAKALARLGEMLTQERRAS